MKLKQFVPDPKLIPAIMVIGAVGYVVSARLIPGVLAKVGSIVPQRGTGV